MPWKVVKVEGGYKVQNKDTGKTYSKKPMSKEKATAQLKAMYANTNEDIGMKLDLALGLLTETEISN